MTQETTAILRTILYQLETAKDLKSAIRAVKVMCSKEDIAVVNDMLKECVSEEDKK